MSVSKTKYGIFVSTVKSTLESAVENDAITAYRRTIVCTLLTLLYFSNVETTTWGLPFFTGTILPLELMLALDDRAAGRFRPAILSDGATEWSVTWRLRSDFVRCPTVIFVSAHAITTATLVSLLLLQFMESLWTIAMPFRNQSRNQKHYLYW